MEFFYNILPKFIKNILKYIVFIIKYKQDININSLENISIKYIYNKKMKLWKNINLWLWNFYSWNIDIWDYSHINYPNTKINWSEKTKIIIWKLCSISWNVSIISKNEHNLNFLTTSSRIIQNDIWKDIIIWNDVWIWANSVILPWIKIWTWAVVWASTVVTKDIPEYAIVVWNPWRIIKYRFEIKKIDELLKSKRWDWDVEKIKTNIKNI